MKRNGIISRRFTFEAATRQDVYTITIPFGNSQKKRIIEKILVGNPKMTTGDYAPLFSVTAECDDFNINHNNDIIASGSASITEFDGNLIYGMSPSFKDGTLSYFSSQLIECNQPWIASDLVLVIECQGPSITPPLNVNFSFVIYFSEET